MSYILKVLFLYNRFKFIVSFYKLYLDIVSSIDGYFLNKCDNWKNIMKLQLFDTLSVGHSLNRSQLARSYIATVTI